MLQLRINLPEYAIIILCISVIIMTVAHVILSVQRWKLKKELHKQEKISKKLDQEILNTIRNRNPIEPVAVTAAKIMKMQEKDGIPQKDFRKIDT